MPTIHLVCGSTGAGKTTFSKNLTLETKAVRFSIDEWMANLFVTDAPVQLEFPWVMERVNRCEKQISECAVQVLEVGRDVVLDLGFIKKEHREKYGSLARSLNVKIRTHYIDTPVSVRWQRVQERNRRKSGTWSFEVTKGMFDFIEGIFEAPTGEELVGQSSVS